MYQYCSLYEVGDKVRVARNFKAFTVESFKDIFKKEGPKTTIIKAGTIATIANKGYTIDIDGIHYMDIPEWCLETIKEE